MNKFYIAVWSVDEELRRGNKNSFHNFINTDGEKCPVATKLHRVKMETIKKIWELIEADRSEEYVLKAVTRGNCMLCGKELTEGIFFCKECEDKASRKSEE